MFRGEGVRGGGWLEDLVSATIFFLTDGQGRFFPVEKRSMVYSVFEYEFPPPPYFGVLQEVFFFKISPPPPSKVKWSISSFYLGEPGC